MAVIALAFHFLQNSDALPGGSVPLVKTAWLFTVLFYWYVMPIIWLCDKALHSALKVVLGIALANMVIRALFELPLMYVTSGWLHAYGIGHDIFSMLLNLLLLLWLSRKNRMIKAAWLKWYLCLSATLFIIESVFALYLRSVTEADGTVFFLPSGQVHSMILTVTGIAVLLTWLAVVYVLRLSHDQHA